MPYKITNEDGDEVDAYSEEELQNLATEKALAEAERIESEKKEEFEKLSSELAQKESELEKLRSKEMNFEHVRKKAEGKEVQVSDEIKSQIEELNSKIEALAAQPKSDVKNDFMKAYISEDDKEKRDKFDYYYAKLGSDAKTKEEVLKASEEALALATNGDFKPSDSRMYSTAPSLNYRNEAPKVITEAAKEIGNALGITEEDRKKYTKKEGK